MVLSWGGGDIYPTGSKVHHPQVKCQPPPPGSKVNHLPWVKGQSPPPPVSKVNHLPFLGQRSTTSPWVKGQPPPPGYIWELWSMGRQYASYWNAYLFYGVFTLAWSGTGGPGLGRMSCMVLIRTFHTAPEQGQGRTQGTFSAPEEWVWYPFFRSWKMFPVMNISVFTVQVQCERFSFKPYNPFFLVQCEGLRIIPVPVPVQASVNTPLVIIPVFFLCP